MIRTFLINLFSALGLLIFFASSGFAEFKNISDREILAENNTMFALNLYDQLKGTEGNLFFSPYSISTALAMTYAGAREHTENQMANVLNFTLNQQKMHSAFASLEAELNAVQEKETVDFTVANALWAQKDYVFLKDFIDLTKKHYGAVLNQVDFKKDSEAARRKINFWVEQKTNEKIKDLLKPGILNALTRLVLTNAIYFKGNWENQFKKSRTKDARFWLDTDTAIEAPMMFQKHKFGYGETDNLQILELPYSGGGFTMIVLLPKKVEGISDLEAMLDMNKINVWKGSLRKTEVQVYLPRFKVSSQFSLGEALAKMGMPDAFGPDADFSGIDGKKDLYISAVVHKAFVDVNEEGTEAAAATGVVMKLTSMPVSPRVFCADHPFLFLIRHNSSGSILFIGRVVNPIE